jgi:hypothetical protein
MDVARIISGEKDTVHTHYGIVQDGIIGRILGNSSAGSDKGCRKKGCWYQVPQEMSHVDV